MDLFLPITSGAFSADLSDDFLSALAERIRRGMFPLAPKSRNDYEVVSQTDSTLRFRSVSLWTGINVGLNDVTIDLIGPDRVEYTIRYWTWTKYAVAVCFALFVVCVLVLTVGRAVLPVGLFVDFDRSPVIGGSMLVFWGLMWPWVLTATHKRSVRTCLEGILSEVNKASGKGE